MVPITGIVGVAGWAGITTLAEVADVHPEELVTVKLYVPDERAEIVAKFPEPLIPPGFIVHVPTKGNPFKMTLPVESMHVGGVIIPIVGAEGVAGCALIITFAEDDEMHPEALVTVKL